MCRRRWDKIPDCSDRAEIAFHKILPLSVHGKDAKTPRKHVGWVLYQGKRSVLDLFSVPEQIADVTARQNPVERVGERFVFLVAKGRTVEDVRGGTARQQQV